MRNAMPAITQLHTGHHHADQRPPCGPTLASLRSEFAPEITFDHDMAALQHVKFGVVLADTVVSSPSTAVSSSPVSKAELSAEPWVWPTQGGSFNPFFFVACSLLLWTTLTLQKRQL